MSFKKIIKDIGCNIDADPERIKLDQNPVLFHRELKAKMIHETVANQFFESMKAYVEDVTKFRKCLLPVQFETSSTSTFGFYSSSETLFRMILDFDDIQPQIIDYLLERIPEFYDDFESDESNATARLILHQLQFLENVVEPEALAQKLLEVIESVSRSAQPELITSIPYIICHSEFNLAVEFLKDLMNESSALMLPILDTLPRLSKESSSMDDIREIVLDKLSTAELESLPLMVKYIFETATPGTIEVIIFKVRERLDFRDLEVAQRQLPESNVPLALILESIKYCLVSSNFIADAWLKTITALEVPAEHKVLDIMICFLLHWANPSNKKVEKLVRKKVTDGCITADLVKETIMNHVKSLSSLWSTILSLAHILLRSTARNPAIEVWCSTVYICLFKSCNSLQKRDIIDYLITHIGSHIASEMNTALTVLLQLAKDDVSSVATFNSFLKDTLYHIDSLDSKQVGWLFDTFSLLALTTGRTDDGSAGLWDEIQNTIRKQLSSVYKRYKTVGVIATLSAIRVLGSKKLCQVEHFSGSSSQRVVKRTQSVNNHPFLGQAIGLLDFAVRSISEYPGCLALLFDELANMFMEDILDQRLQVWIQENLTSDFTERYLADSNDVETFIDEMDNSSSKLKPVIQLNLDEDESPVSVTLYQSIYKQELRKKRSLMTVMCSVFNLLQSCEKVLNEGSLENIDALLGSGIVLFPFDDLDNLLLELEQNELEDACDMVFYTINWLRELINAFSVIESDGDIQKKLPLRLRNILELETVLAELLKHTKHYEPLEFQLSSVVLLKGSQYPVSTAGQKSNIFKSLDVTRLRTYMRALNMQALQILDYNTQEENKEVGLTEINYLLMDLNEKIDIKTAQSASNNKKKTSEEEILFGNSIILSRMDTRDFMKQVIQHLPNIFKTLEILFAEIQVQDTEAGRVAEESKDTVIGMGVIFDIILKLLSWSDIKDHTNDDLLKEIIHIIAQRIGEGERSQSFQDELNMAGRYLSCYGANIPQSRTATILFKIVLQLMSFSKDQTVLKQDAVKVVNTIMSTSWLDKRDIKKEVPFLLEQSIKLNEDPLSVIDNFVNEILPSYEHNGKLEDHPFLEGETIPQYCQAIILQITDSLDVLKRQHNEEGGRDPELILVQNARIVKAFEKITEYIKAKDHRVLFGVLLKSSRVYIEHFTKYSIPYFTKVFRTNKEEIVGIFKDFQMSTRALQIICSHVKAMKDIKLSAFVPPLKKALEIVIYQVKMLLVKNHAPSEAFFLGALKHRDIRGAEISSQIPRESESENSADEGSTANGSGRSSRCASPSRRIKKKAKTTTTKTKKNSSGRTKKSTSNNQTYRTSSVVPSSSEDEEEEEEVELQFDMDLSEEEQELAKRKQREEEEEEMEEEEEEDEIDELAEVKPEPGSPEPSSSPSAHRRDEEEEEEIRRNKLNHKSKRRRLQQRN